MKRFDRMVLRGCASAAVILVAVLAWPAAGWSQTVGQVVLGEITKWGIALQNSTPTNPTPVVNKYMEDKPPVLAILLATCSAKDSPVAIGRAAITEYFVKKFLPAEPRLTSIGTPTADGDDRFIFGSGVYEFTLKTGGREITVPARYTYIFEKTGLPPPNEYLIVQHHSSLEPNNPAADCP